MIDLPFCPQQFSGLLKPNLCSQSHRYSKELFFQRHIGSLQRACEKKLTFLTFSQFSLRFKAIIIRLNLLLTTSETAQFGVLQMQHVSYAETMLRFGVWYWTIHMLLPEAPYNPLPRVQGAGCESEQNKVKWSKWGLNL